jgi:asparagine synthase (glutamine-hydrolysing)
MTAADGERLLADYLNHLDQPSNDGFNSFCISKFAHDHGLKVVLSGLGGDELFGGYPSFRLIPRMKSWHRRLSLTGPLRGIGGRMGENWSHNHKLQRLSAFLSSPGRTANAYWAVRGIFTPSEAKKLSALYAPDGAASSNGTPFHDEMLGQPTVEDEVGYLETTRYMRNQLLKDSDVMSMAWGLELRVPLVDRKLADMVSRIPAELRYAPGKRLLLDAVPEIPEWVSGAHKRGFRFPFERWIGRQWGEQLTELDACSPVPLKTWYRRWCLLTLNHFLVSNNIQSLVSEAMDTSVVSPTAN